MTRTLYLVNPRAAIPGYFGADVATAAGIAPMVGIADLAIATVAAFAPRDWRVILCDEHVQAVDLDIDADVVGLTGKVTQRPRLVELARAFRRRGKTVVAGGPCASLEPEAVRDEVDVLVVGELESVAGELFADLARGRPQALYVGERLGLERSPAPAWSLYPNERAMIGCVQTSRGCPFECEFCDVITYLGRRQRHKPVAQVLGELEALYAIGYRSVFLADDNFTVYRRRAKELLEALRAWNEARDDGPMRFSTQVSIDAARDAELLQAAAEAGIEWVFVGIETPNAESLRECHKPQNLAVDLQEAVQAFLDHGIAVTGGMIVGFDHDGPGIFELQRDFAMASPIPVFSLGALAAPAGTPLHARLAAVQRLVPGDAAVAALPWGTNIVPARLTRDELRDGLRWLARALYEPPAFADRLLHMVRRLAPHPLHGRARPAPPRAVEAEAMFVVKRLARLGRGEAELLRAGLEALRERPHAARAIMTALFRYAQIRFMYEAGAFWDPAVARPA